MVMQYVCVVLRDVCEAVPSLSTQMHAAVDLQLSLYAGVALVNLAAYNISPSMMIGASVKLTCAHIIVSWSRHSGPLCVFWFYMAI